ncbi:hypothetical protein RCH33_2242 [Flavobacterium daejeonense]|nr:hypothetical protein RCH33_2242 [Flavobacterium daejeonense]
MCSFWSNQFLVFSFQLFCCFFCKLQLITVNYLLFFLKME